MTSTNENSVVQLKPVLVHAHVFYKEMWAELKECIENLFSSLPDENQKNLLIVTLTEPHAEIMADIKQSFANAQIRILPNRGYDVGSFVQVIRQVNLDDFGLVAKIHSKRNMPIGTWLNGKDLSGARWRNYALAFCKTKENAAKCLKAFATDERLGMISDYHLINTVEDHYDKTAVANAKEMLKRLNLPSEQKIFVMGTMFICRAELLKPVQELGLTINDFEEFNGARLVTSKAHDMERFLGFLITAQNYTVKDVITEKMWWHKIKDGANKLLSFFWRCKEDKNGNIKIKVCKIPMPFKWVNRRGL